MSEGQPDPTVCIRPDKAASPVPPTPPADLRRSLSVRAQRTRVRRRPGVLFHGIRSMASVPFAQSIWPTSRDGERQRTSSRAPRPGASPPHRQAAGATEALTRLRKSGNVGLDDAVSHRSRFGPGAELRGLVCRRGRGGPTYRRLALQGRLFHCLAVDFSAAGRAAVGFSSGANATKTDAGGCDAPAATTPSNRMREGMSHMPRKPGFIWK